jgi:hypothetical protein
MVLTLIFPIDCARPLTVGTLTIGRQVLPLSVDKKTPASLVLPSVSEEVVDIEQAVSVSVKIAKAAASPNRLLIFLVFNINLLK